MPELPDILAYIHALEARVLNQTLLDMKLSSPFLLRSVDPPLSAAFGKKVVGFRRLGKRIVFELEGDLFLVVHLMIAGRLHWKEGPAKPNRRNIAVFTFSNGTLTMSEAGTKKRASLHLIKGEAGLAAHDRGGLEVLDSSLEDFSSALTRENHTLKRALTDQHLFSGIGNAYSDEILHEAKMSPMKLTRSMSEEEIRQLYDATISSLQAWSSKLGEEAEEAFPEKVTAFREDFAVHGRYGKPCPRCGTPVQRIVYAENEANYCPTCQTGGKLLADRALSRLLKQDWPKTLDELEQRRSQKSSV